MRVVVLREHDPRIWKRTSASGEQPVETAAQPENDVQVPQPAEPRTVRRPRSFLDLWAMFSVVFGAQFLFGMWMNARGFLWNDAISRAAGALLALHGPEPDPGDLGFIWMPLPVLVELGWVSAFPTWPGVVSSGFASTITTAIAGGATAALLLYTSRRLGLPEWLGWTYALLVAANPMLFLYAGNGMSEGVAAPFLVGAVAFLTLFWHSGQRRYAAASGIALALGFATLYQAIPYGGALFAALMLSTLRRGPETRPVPDARWPDARWPDARWRHTAVAATLLVVPGVCVAVLWVWANAVYTGDPWFFATSEGSNLRYTATVGTGREHLTGDLVGTAGFVIERTIPFLVPGLFLLLVRALDGRFWRRNTVSLTVLLMSVPLGMSAPLLYVGASFGWLRFFVYPLFVAAGWGLYEVTASQDRRRAATIVLIGWVVAAPVVFWAMAEPEFGREEHHQARALVSGQNASESGFAERTRSIERTGAVARQLSELQEDDRVALDSSAWSIVVQLSPDRLRKVVLAQDSGFREAIDDPGGQDVRYLLVPNPAGAAGDLVVQRWPALWSGQASGFELVADFPESPQQWRLYRYTG